MSDQQYPRDYEGDALRSLGIDPTYAALISRITVASETAMGIELPGQTIAVVVQAPIADGRGWAIKVGRTLLPGGAVSVAAGAHPSKADRRWFLGGHAAGLFG